MIGFKLEQGRNIEPRTIFHTLLRHGLLFTENVRQVPSRSFEAAALTTQPDELANGRELARYLFALKNSRDLEERSLFAAIGEFFEKLTTLRFDVVLDRTRATADDEPGEAAHDQVSLAILISDAPRGREFALGRSGAGVGEALFLSAIIEGPVDGVILLDEPAANLFPTWQRELLSEIKRRSEPSTPDRAGANQFFIITHSPSAVAPDDIARTSRFRMSDGRTQRATLSLPAGDLLNRIQKELRSSTDARSLLFDSGVILVEGETELGALPVWFEKVYGQSLDRFSLSVYDVGGDQNFATYVAYVSRFAIPWAIICDGNVIRNGSRCSIARQLTAAGIANVPKLERSMFAERKTKLSPLGVFTASEEEGVEFEGLPCVKTHLEEAKRTIGGAKASKVRIGRYIAETYPCPPEICALFDAVAERFELQPLARAQ
jgi:hypothetical protein